MEDLAPEDLVDEWSDLSASSLGSGARLGRYELLIPIAYGGMARVWAARLHGQRGFSKTVAIKTILPHLAHNPEFERMFLDEARIAAGVHNPNVCEIYELGEEGNVLYLVMEWVNGDSLMHVLRGASGKVGTPIDARLAARIVADACAGLHAAHELTDDDGRLLNVVHRDVSPHNILVSLEGNVKVADFGVAKALGQTHQETAAGQVKGKVAYMAPEQIGGNAFDRRADIFGMGCVLYEAATGVQPFRGGGDPQIMQAVLRGTYEHPSTLVKGFPAELAAVIDRALAPEPRARFATAERMRVAIEEWLAKSGSIVTSTQVGSLVRQRLGPSLEKRREHVKAAMAALQPDAPTTRPLGHTPSQPQPGQSHTGQSHSGVVSTGAGQPAVPSPGPMRARTPSLPQAPPPAPPPALPPPLPARAGTAAAAPSGARYVVAAIAGVVFALVVGGIGVAVWLSMRSHSGETAVTPEAPARASAAITAAPPAPAPAPPPPAAVAPAPSSVASAPPPAAAPSVTASAPAASAAPTTIDVTDLPTAKPAWPTGAAAPAAPRASAASPALPANPY